MKKIRLYAYGKSTENGAWYIDSSRVVNRIYYVNSGKAVVSFAHKEHTLIEGKLYIIPQCNDFFTVYAKNFDHTFFDFYNSQILPSDKILEFDKSDSNIEALFNYLNSFIEKDPQKQHYESIEHFLFGFLNSLEKTYSLPYISNSYITSAINLIHNECSTLTTNQIAKRLNINESYFIRLFSSVMGITPSKYIRACRVSFGKQLLQNGASVEEAAEKCGYSSPSAFYNATIAELNITPSKLKNFKHDNKS